MFDWVRVFQRDHPYVAAGTELGLAALSYFVLGPALPLGQLVMATAVALTVTHVNEVDRAYCAPKKGDDLPADQQAPAALNTAAAASAAANDNTALINGLEATTIFLRTQEEQDQERKRLLEDALKNNP